MMRRLALLLSAAALLAGCEIDDSAPTRPRTANILTPDNKAQENAEHRSLEQPPPQLPTGGAELPGHSALPLTDPSIVTLDVAPGTATQPLKPSFPGFPIHGFYGPSGWDAIGNTFGPVDTYTRDTYTGILPHLPPNPGSIPMKEATIIPGSDWAVEWSWGQGLALTQAPHRNWPAITAYYQVADAPHHPTYLFDIQKHIDVPQYNGTYLSDLCTAAGQDIWFFFNAAALPALMVLEPPCSVRYTHTYSQDSNFTGVLSTAGPAVPAPFPGSLKWSYPFLNPDGTVRQLAPPTTRPLTRPATLP